MPVIQMHFETVCARCRATLFSQTEPVPIKTLEARSGVTAHQLRVVHEPDCGGDLWAVFEWELSDGT